MKSRDISDRIKELRIRAGLSLTDLSRLIDTSPSTLSRYENGWQRFEIYTLKKIATALGCRLRVEFEPLLSSRISVKPNYVVKRLSRLFWDKKLKQSDLKRYSVWVAERVLEYGTLEDIHSLMAFWGRRRFLKIVGDCRFQSANTAALWDRILEREGMICTKRSCQREARPFWID